MIEQERIKEALVTLGDTARDIMVNDIPIHQWDGKKGLSVFRDENTPSMVWYSEKQMFKDFSSGQTMDYLDFAMKYHNLSFVGALKELFELVDFEFDNSLLEESVNKNYFKNFKFAKDEASNDRMIVNDYLERRKISIETLDHFEVKENNNGDVAFQFKDINGRLIQTKYRVSRPAKNGDFKWYWQKDTDNCPMLYGINKIDVNKPVLITEGYFDALACYEAGFQNVVSIPGGANDLNWINFNFDLLEKCYELILWFDDDEVGLQSVKDVANRIGIYKTKIVNSNPEVKEKIREYYAEYKQDIDKIDANNVLVVCGKNAVLKFINTAEIIENPLVERLMDVEEVSVQDLPRISTGFKSMDKVFYGDFINSLNIITGKPAAGKSIILNTMFVISPLENGEKVFIYSGEIPNGMLLGNIIKPLASRRHIMEFENVGQPNGYSVTREASKAIKAFYRDQLFNYNDLNQFDTNSKSVLQSMEYSYRRYGVTNFIIDSLLTLDCSCEDGDDKYEKQKNFVISLKNFTNKYPIRVALVAHSRKLPAGVKEIGGDDIAGSSDILKCCNRAFSIDRIYDDPEGYSTRVRCIKDRETGLLDKEVKLYYDKASYRIYSDMEELNKQYSWEKQFRYNYTDFEKSKIIDNKKYKDKADEVLGVI